MKKVIPARAELLPEDFRALGLDPDTIFQWEDGRRTDGRRGEFEWWYFDAKMDDGASLVVVFYSNPVIPKGRGFHPLLKLDLTRADGSKVCTYRKVDADQCSFSADGCDVRIGASTFVGDLHHYHIHVEQAGITADISLDGNTSAWRPGTGRIRFGQKDFFAWLPAVPEGNVSAVITTPEGVETYQGTGYHDHNWGNAVMLKLMHHWYWGRAKIGNYQVISSYIIGQKKYGYPHAPILMLKKNGQLIGDSMDVHFTQSDPVLDEESGKHYHKVLRYDYSAEGAQYTVTYRVEDFLERSRMGTDKQPIQFLLSLKGLSPAYLRFAGTASIEKRINGQVVESASSPAIWELMYFGDDADV